MSKYKSAEEAKAAFNEIIEEWGRMRNKCLRACLMMANFLNHNGPELIGQGDGRTADQVLCDLADQWSMTLVGIQNRADIGRLMLQVGVADLDLAPDHVRTVFNLAMGHVEAMEIDDD